MGWGGHAAVGDEDRLDPKQAARVLRRSFRMLHPYRGAMVGALVALVGYTLATEAGPFILRYAIDHGLTVRHPSRAVLERAGLAYLGSAVAILVLERLQILLVNRVGESFLRDLRVRVFRHILSMPMAFFDREQTGRLVSRMTADVDALEALVQQGLLIFVTSGLLFVLVIAVMLWLSPPLFLVCLLCLPLVIASSRRFRRDSNIAYLGVRDRISQTLSSLQEGLAGVRIIQAFGREGAQVRRFAHHNEAQMDANMEATRIASRYFPVIEFSGAATTAAIVGFGGLLVHARITTIGTVTAFVLYLTYLFDPIQQMSQLFNLVQSATAALGKLFGLLDTRSELVERPSAVDLPRGAELVVAGVSFSYGASADAPLVLAEVDLRVAPGERLALVGPTGAGKSTLAKLMARLYDPVQGSVSYGKVDLRDATLASLRERIIVVPQEGFLFDGTILDNVRAAQPSASEHDVRRALRLIGAEERLDALPQGLLTQVQERGTRLSAGERQLVSLARAALANPEVLVLDEATSNLDPGTEAEVEAAMGSLMEGRTVIVIAHRLSTAARADRVAVVDGGRLLELGTHEELVATGGRYAALYASWDRDSWDRDAAHRARLDAAS